MHRAQPDDGPGNAAYGADAVTPAAQLPNSVSSGNCATRPLGRSHGPAGCGGGRWNGVGHPVNPYRLRHILEVVLAEVLKTDMDLTAHMAERRSGNINAVGFGQSLESRSYVYTVTVEVAAFTAIRVMM